MADRRHGPHIIHDVLHVILHLLYGMHIWLASQGHTSTALYTSAVCQVLPAEAVSCAT
jgi:hypothetical protein